MIRFDRIVDRGTDADKRRLAEVATLFRKVFPREAEYADELVDEISVRKQSGYDPVLLTAADHRDQIIGFAWFYYFPAERFGYLNYIGSDPERPRRGIGRALYESVREYLKQHGAIGLLLEFPPDDAALLSDADRLAANRDRARFYEGFDARPILNTRWHTGTPRLRPAIPGLRRPRPAPSPAPPRVACRHAGNTQIPLRAP